MNAKSIRYENDQEMYEALLKNPDVIKVNEYIKKAEEDGPMGTRRRLLATSVRLSRTMAPQIHKMADECVETLGMDIPLELYVYSSPQFNAACFKPEDGQLFVMFSSSLLEAFQGSELKFVIGHEFGHHVYQHHDIPIGYLLKGQQRPDPRLALDLFAWSRNAEISADRAGAICAQDLDGVARSLFKLASGLSDKVIEFSLDDFLKQVDEMRIEDEEPGQGAPQEDWFSTHPFSPLRVRALKLFHESCLVDEKGTTVQELEVGVQKLMGMMEPSYLDGRTDTATAMQRLLFAGAISVAHADGEISEDEIAVFEKFFGKGEFNDRLNIDIIKGKLDGRIGKMNELASMTQKMQVMRDLCIVSKANGNQIDSERRVLNKIADGLGVSRTFICHSIEQNLEPD
ncbi:MAG: M48 family metalloprotease [Gammaproteobacteria bacterium]|nr:M48 family metalloprotease [Gammaproteobacteria bacterium]